MDETSYKNQSGDQCIGHQHVYIYMICSRTQDLRLSDPSNIVRHSVLWRRDHYFVECHRRCAQDCDCFWEHLSKSVTFCLVFTSF
jgi:hypothetical protein